MNVEANGLPERPRVRPADPRFSSGPCKKYPGWDITHLNTEFLGRSHRAKLSKQRLVDAIDISHQMPGLPADWKLGIIPGSDTDAARYKQLGYEGHANCADNMAHGLRELGIDLPSPPQCSTSL